MSSIKITNDGRENSDSVTASFEEDWGFAPNREIVITISGSGATEAEARVALSEAINLVRGTLDAF